jgi:hypothetical protein
MSPSDSSSPLFNYWLKNAAIQTQMLKHIFEEYPTFGNLSSKIKSGAVAQFARSFC